MTRSAIAKSTGVNKSTISREITRNTGKKGYRYKQASRSMPLGSMSLLVKDSLYLSIKNGA
ncbi:hypothetical protein CRYPA_552 [uncultured Candidatus Thioglobus sp.]|nr:hypothetical protein CRYPA_552 [uncultured Candidatus Thioglobus sp.]